MASIDQQPRRNGRPGWRARYRTPAGQQRTKTFNRKVDAERFLATIESAKAAGAFADPALARITLGAWAERWLPGQTHLKPTTYDRYEGAIRKHIKPTWADDLLRRSPTVTSKRGSPS